MRPLFLAAALSVVAFATQAAEAPKINGLHWLGSHTATVPTWIPPPSRTSAK